jgi:hypothetical protein
MTSDDNGEPAMKLPTVLPRGPAQQQPGAAIPIDFETLAAEISNHGKGPVAYAPPQYRPDAIVEQVVKFGDLPTKELDDIIAAAENEIAALKSDAQAIRDMYSKHTERVVVDVKRLQGEVKLAMTLMSELRKQCGLLDTNVRAANITDREVEE